MRRENAIHLMKLNKWTNKPKIYKSKTSDKLHFITILVQLSDDSILVHLQCESCIELAYSKQIIA